MQFPELEYNFPFKIADLKSNTSIAYTDEGNGKEVLLFIHGLASYIPSWKKNTPVLSKEFRCIAIDLPGYGKSQQGANSGSMDYFAEVVHEFILHLNLERVHLIGHSMGGEVALTIALNYPEAVKSIVLLAPAGVEVFSGFDKFLLLSTFDDQLICNGTDEQLKANWEYNFYKFPDEASFLYEDSIKMKSCKNFDFYREVIKNSIKGMLEKDMPGKLASLNKPVYIMFGENDRLIPNPFLHKDLTPLDIVLEAEKTLPTSTHLIIPECGHFIQFEKAEFVNSEIRNYVKKNN